MQVKISSLKLKHWLANDYLIKAFKERNHHQFISDIDLMRHCFGIVAKMTDAQLDEVIKKGREQDAQELDAWLAPI